MVRRYDAAVFSLPEYAQSLPIPQHFILPAIDPFSLINQELSRSDASLHLDRYAVPQDLPLVVQAGRFDKWKDPQGVIDAFRKATAHIPATLVLAGNAAADDPESSAVYESVCARAGEPVIGGDVGGIRHQIEHGRSGFLVGDIEGAAKRIGLLLGDASLRRNLGRRARSRVRRQFLMTRLLEDWLDLIDSLVLRRPVASRQKPASSG